MSFNLTEFGQYISHSTKIHTFWSNEENDLKGIFLFIMLKIFFNDIDIKLGQWLYSAYFLGIASKKFFHVQKLM